MKLDRTINGETQQHPVQTICIGEDFIKGCSKSSEDCDHCMPGKQMSCPWFSDAELLNIVRKSQGYLTELEGIVHELEALSSTPHLQSMLREQLTSVYLTIADLAGNMHLSHLILLLNLHLNGFGEVAEGTATTGELQTNEVPQ